MSERPTPETNALISVGLENADRECVPADFARKLERERDEVQKAVNGLCKHFKVSPANTTLLAVEVLRIERERDEARERIERQKLEINRLNGATNHAGGTPLKIALRERDKWAAMCDQYKQERDEARDAIRVLAEHGESEIQRITKERDEAREEANKLSGAYEDATNYYARIIELKDELDKLNTQLKQNIK